MKRQNSNPKHEAKPIDSTPIDSTMCGSKQPDDGVDPRYDRKEGVARFPKLDRKGAQLCAQVRRTLEFVVPEVLVDSEWDAVVMDVEPAPNTAHLLVLIRPTMPLDEVQCQQLELELLRKNGTIRTSVAQAIHRRKAPSLLFRVVPS